MRDPRPTPSIPPQLPPALPPSLLTTGVWSRPLGDSRITWQDAAKATGPAVNMEKLPSRGQGNSLSLHLAALCNACLSVAVCLQNCICTKRKKEKEKKAALKDQVEDIPLCWHYDVKLCVYLLLNEVNNKWWKMPFMLNSKRRNSSNCFIIFYNVSVTFAIEFLLSPDRFRGPVPFSRVADLSWCHRKQDANAVLPACFVSGDFFALRKKEPYCCWMRRALCSLEHTVKKKKKTEKNQTA